MGDPFRKVLPGERLDISAHAYNAFVDAAMANRRRDPRAAPLPFSGLEPGLIWVRNSYGFTLDRFRVVATGAPAILPADNLADFQSSPVLDLDAAGLSAANQGKWVVTQEPLGAGAVGRAMVTGITPLQVHMAAESHRFVRYDPGGDIGTSNYGPIEILWAESGTGAKWIVARLNGGASRSYRWLKLTRPWLHGTPGYRLEGHPCTAWNGGDVDETTTLRIFCSSTPIAPGWRAPNCQPDDVVAFVESIDGRLQAADAWIWDDPPYTRKLLGRPSGGIPIPRGWALCDGVANAIANGGSGMNYQDRVLRFGSSIGATGGTGQVTIPDHPASSTADVAHVTHTFPTGDGPETTIFATAGHHHAIAAIEHGTYDVMPPYINDRIIERLMDGEQEDGG